MSSAPIAGRVSGARIALALASVEHGEDPHAGVGIAQVQLHRDAKLVAVAGDFQYLYEFFKDDHQPPAVAFGVLTDGVVQSLAHVSEINVPAGHAQLALWRVSGASAVVDRAAGYLLAIEYLFRISPISRIDIALEVEPMPVLSALTAVDVTIMGCLRHRGRGTRGRVDHLIVGVERNEWNRRPKRQEQR